MAIILSYEAPRPDCRCLSPPLYPVRHDGCSFACYRASVTAAFPDYGADSLQSRSSTEAAPSITSPSAAGICSPALYIQYHLFQRSVDLTCVILSFPGPGWWVRTPWYPLFCWPQRICLGLCPLPFRDVFGKAAEQYGEPEMTDMASIKCICIPDPSQGKSRTWPVGSGWLIQTP